MKANSVNEQLRSQLTNAGQRRQIKRAHMGYWQSHQEQTAAAQQMKLQSMRPPTRMVARTRSGAPGVDGPGDQADEDRTWRTAARRPGGPGGRTRRVGREQDHLGSEFLD